MRWNKGKRYDSGYPTDCITAFERWHSPVSCSSYLAVQEQHCCMLPLLFVEQRGKMDVYFWELEVMYLVYKAFYLFTRTSQHAWLLVYFPSNIFVVFVLWQFIWLISYQWLNMGKRIDSLNNVIMFSAEWKGVASQRHLLWNKRESNFKHRIYHALRSLHGPSFPPEAEAAEEVAIPSQLPNGSCHRHFLLKVTISPTYLQATHATCSQTCSQSHPE